MHTIALVLACLACANHGRRIKQATTEGVQDGSDSEHTVSVEESVANTRAGPPNVAKVLPMLLASFSDPAAAFSLHVPGERLATRDPNGLRTVRMQQNEIQDEDYKRSRDAEEYKRMPVAADRMQQDEEYERMPWEREEFKDHLMERSLISQFIGLPSQVMSFQDKFIQKTGLKESEAARVVTPGDSFGQLQFFPLVPVGQLLASTSTFDNDLRKWTGNVTRLSSGAFVGIGAKMLSSLDLTATNGVELKLRPDSTERRFKIMLRDSSYFKGITWAASFTVGSAQPHWDLSERGDPESVRIPYSTLTPTLFGTPVPDLKIDLTNIMGMQLSTTMEGDLNPLFMEGTFELDVLDVATY